MISFTRRGGELALKIEKRLALQCVTETSVTRYTYEKYPVEGAVSFSSGRKLVAEIFKSYDALLFIAASGIAVRLIAPYIEAKTCDPAVLCIDEQGTYVISLLSGHLGGANALTKLVADVLEAVPVITTATDTGGRFSPDSFAKANHLFIENMDTAKHIAAAVLQDEKLGFYSEYPCINIPDVFQDDDCRYGICISTDERKMPFQETLRLIPQDMILGVGCKKYTDTGDFECFVLDRMKQYHIWMKRVRCICSIDLKREEQAILAFAKKYGIPFMTYSAQELRGVQGAFTPSAFVEETTGVDNVCERSAVIQGGQLLVGKQKGPGMTLAVGRLDMKIDFMAE